MAKPARYRRQSSDVPCADRSRSSLRCPEVDAFRGLAILLMVPFHLLVDLNVFCQARMGGPLPLPPAFWGYGSSLIGGMFLLAAGASSWLGQPTRLRKVAKVGGFALLISLISLYLTPHTPIYFGILHCIAISYLLVTPILKKPAWVAGGIGAVCIGVGTWMQDQPFRSAGWSWLGLVRNLEMSDHYPLLPWAGWMFVGVAVASGLYSRDTRSRLSDRLRGSAGVRFAGWLGRNSLAIYLLHQPVLLSLLYALGFFRNFG